MVDRREHGRKEVSIEMRLLVRGETPTIIPCRVVDISQSGAKVRIDVRYRLPRNVFLVRNENENIYECETAWQIEQTAGLTFVGPCARGKHQDLLREIAIAEPVGRT